MSIAHQLPVLPAAPAAPATLRVVDSAERAPRPDSWYEDRASDSLPSFNVLLMPSSMIVEGAGPKSLKTAAFLCFFLGILGAHRFYVGKTGSGVLMALTLGGLGLWALVDFFRVLAGTFKDSEQRPVLNWV